jgi:nifR3 family TIM-barrel protein
MFPILKGKAILAPMAGITDIAFRSLCKRYGAALTITEMVSAEAVIRQNKKTFALFQRDKSEKPFCIQLFGNDPDQIAKAAKLVEPYCGIIDINFGCPVEKIVKQGAGSALLLQPEKVREIMERTNEKIKVPITAKIRSGIRGKAVAVKIAKICEESGASAICVHPRTREQGYSGKADWKIIKNVKDAVSIPVVGNGDIKKPEDAKRMLQQTGCDYVMIGRAARGNPFIFKQINDFLDRGTYDELSDKEKLKIFLEYVNLAHQHKLSFVDIKMQAAYFTKGLPDSNVLRNRLMKTRSIQEIKSLLSN